MHIEGVYFFDHTTGLEDFRIEAMDDEMILIRSDGVTYDLPIYSKLFVMREAWMVFANPENKY